MDKQQGDGKETQVKLMRAEQQRDKQSKTGSLTEKEGHRKTNIYILYRNWQYKEYTTQ